jgi:hypothetical protein
MSPPDCPCIPIKNFNIGVCYAGYVCSTDWDEPESQVSRARMLVFMFVRDSNLVCWPCAHLGLKAVAPRTVQPVCRPCQLGQYCEEGSGMLELDLWVLEETQATTDQDNIEFLCEEVRRCLAQFRAPPPPPVPGREAP